ncbi:MAG: hypothetical protein E2598_00370 [Sphingobium sp.]|nr:hypothetical protein [Sphingobium sp.]
MTGKNMVSIMVLALALSACGGTKDSGNAANAVQNAVNSVEAAANVVENAANTAGNAVAPSPLAGNVAKYVGKYPFDKVDGQSWDGDPAIKAAISAAVSDAKVRKRVLDSEGPATPIAQKDGKVLSWGCETHNCGPHNWTTLIDAQSGSAEVCYYDSDADTKQARWFKDGKESRRDGACPSGDE